MVVGQSIPSGHRQVKMVLIAALAGVLNGDSDTFALPTHTFISRGACISCDNLAAAVRAW